LELWWERVYMKQLVGAPDRAELVLFLDICKLGKVLELR
jgi:hypothetical protein